MERGILTYAKRSTDVGVSPRAPSVCHFLHKHTNFNSKPIIIILFSIYLFFGTAAKRKAPWLHRCRALRHVHQEKSHVYRPGHRRQHLSPEGKRLDLSSAEF